MDKSTDASTTSKYGITEEINWAELYPRAHVLARRLVYKYRIPCWYGQEEDLADDVMQETARRIIERQQKAARGEATPIELPEQMMATIAHNYILDLIRREHRVIRLSIEELTSALKLDGNYSIQMEEVAIENINNEWLFLQLARKISSFPSKQRQAILVDLANHTCFNEQPTPLQAAFLTVGINLQAYQQPLPDNAKEREHHTALLYHAYKRLRLIAVQQDGKEAA